MPGPKFNDGDKVVTANGIAYVGRNQDMNRDQYPYSLIRNGGVQFHFDENGRQAGANTITPAVFTLSEAKQLGIKMTQQVNYYQVLSKKDGVVRLESVLYKNKDEGRKVPGFLGFGQTIKCDEELDFDKLT